MLVYLMESTKGKIHLATKLYIHDGSHEDIFELTLDGYNKIKDDLCGRRNEKYKDSHGNVWKLRNHGVSGEVYFANGIKNIKEFHINNNDDLILLLGHPRVCPYDRIKLVEIWNKQK